MNTSQTGVDLIKKYEGVRLTAYRDSVGIWTIGYGHTAGVEQGMTITAEKAEWLLKEDLKIYENYVKQYVKVPLNQNEFDALVSFTYNVGPGNLQKSVLLTKLNSGLRAAAADEFPKWVYAGGIKLNGLVKRRAEERELFLMPAEYQESEEEVEKLYNWTVEVPEWARPTVQKLLDKGYLVGNDKGELELTYSMLKMFVINDRAGLYGN